MKEGKVDLRVLKTKRNLYEALLSLMEKSSFEDIKVSDICDEALINRSTFYSHFEDKYNLLFSLVNDFKEALVLELTTTKTFSNSKEYFMNLIRLLLKHMNERKKFYISIMNNNKNSIAMDMIHDTINNDITKYIEKEGSEIPSRFISRFYSGAIFSALMEWISNPSKYTDEDIISYLDILIPDKI